MMQLIKIKTSNLENLDQFIFTREQRIYCLAIRRVTMKNLFLSLVLFLLGTVSVQANEYPTEETVRYVLNCMAELGGQNDENLYTCACKYDSIREHMTFAEYEEGYTYERNKDMPGEKGAFFRDNERGRDLYKKLVEARKSAEESCIVVKHIELKKPTNKE